MKNVIVSVSHVLQAYAFAVATWLLLSLLTAVGAEVSNHAPILLTGKLKVFVPDDASERALITEANAAVVLFTNGWRYSLDFTAHHMGSGPKAIEIACDGKDVYDVITFDPLVHRRYQETLPSSAHAGTSGQTVRIYSGLVPHTTVPVEIFPWFAFCGRSYVRSLPEQGKMTNVFARSFWPTNEVRCAASFEATSDLFPNKWQVFKPGFLQISDGGDHSKPLRKNYPPPFEQGFPGADYQVNSWTPAQGMAFPKEAVFEYKDLEDYGGKWKSKISVSIIWHLDKVEFGARAELIPRVKVDTQVADSRVPGRGSIHYFTTTNSPDLKLTPPIVEKLSRNRARIRINGK